MDIYDALIVGGGLAGLLCAREIAKEGFRVRVFEEHLEIGRPEKCDGLISLRALKELGFDKDEKFIRNRIKKASLFSPKGYELSLKAENQEVIVLDRALFDKEIAKQASNHGVEISLGSKVKHLKKEGLKLENSDFQGRYIVDAGGCQSLLNYRKEGVLQAGKYEISGDWFDKDRVELYFNQELTPGFFLWLIPLSEDYCKIGAAGYRINPFKVIDRFLKNKKCTIVRKIAAPINVGGTLTSFQKENLFFVGDAAGQTKPTTAGGIYTGGMGGIFAGKSIVSNLKGERSLSYTELWKRKFSKEFDVMKMGRKLFERFNNDALDRLFKILKDSSFEEKVPLEGDFDFHSKVFLSSLKIKEITKLLFFLAEVEYKNLLKGLKKISKSK
ncbi:MAG: NAD(P)/FAD-dependent oxidoreductase [Nitrososphaerales archaeon]